MPERQTPGDRVKLFREDVVCLPQKRFAAQLGFSSGLIGQIETGKTLVSRNVLEKLADHFQVNPAWVLEGRQPMVFDVLPGFAPGYRDGPRVTPPNLDRPSPGDFAYGDEEFVFVHRYDVNLSAGPGLIPVDNAESEQLAFSSTWLRRNSINHQLCGLVRVRGDSMFPTIPDGAMVLVHVPEMHVEKEGIFAFSRAGEAFIKRLIPINTGKDGRPTSMVILSDNPAYPPDVLVGEALNEIRIVGRIRCAMTTF